MAPAPKLLKLHAGFSKQLVFHLPGRYDRPDRGVLEEYGTVLPDDVIESIKRTK